MGETAGATSGATSAGSPHVAVVVVTWNGCAHTLACLESLARLEGRCRISTIVVDNGSSDGTLDAVERRFPAVELLALPRNTGFAKGNNHGIERALAMGADHVLVLNNDTTVDPGMLDALVKEADRRPDAGALCPLVLYADPPDLIWYAGGSFDPERGYDVRQQGYRERDDGQFASVARTGRACGAAMLVPGRVLEEVGPFDADLFLYMEDVEWSLRLARASYHVYVVPEARAWHHVSAGAEGDEHSPVTAYYLARNTLEVCARHSEARGLRALRRHAATVLAQVAHARRAQRPVRNLGSIMRGWRDYMGGRLGPLDHS